jgi:hypothetical protein
LDNVSKSFQTFVYVLPKPDSTGPNTEDVDAIRFIDPDCCSKASKPDNIIAFISFIYSDKLMNKFLLSANFQIHVVRQATSARA